MAAAVHQIKRAFVGQDRKDAPMVANLFKDFERDLKGAAVRP